MALPLLRRRRAHRFFTPVVSLPQINTTLSATDHLTAAGHTYALIRTGTGHYTVVLTGDGASLPDWRQVLTYPRIDVGADAWDVTAMTVVIETVPAHAAAHTEWAAAEGHRHLRDSDIAVRAHMSITFNAGDTRRKNDADEMAVEVGTRLPTLLGSLTAAGLPVSPLTSDEIALIAGEAFHGVAEPGIDFSDIAPRADVHRVRDVFCHDDLLSSSWVLAPHVLDSRVIDHLAAPQPAAPRTRLAVTWRTVRLADGVTTDDPIRLTFSPALQRFGGIYTVTEPLGRHPAIEPVRDELPLYGRLGMRNGYDRHAELLAAGLGIGVLLPEHSDIDDEPLRHRHPLNGS